MPRRKWCGNQGEDAASNWALVAVLDGHQKHQCTTELLTNVTSTWMKPQKEICSEIHISTVWSMKAVRYYSQAPPTNRWTNLLLSLHHVVTTEWIISDLIWKHMNTINPKEGMRVPKFLLKLSSVNSAHTNLYLP